MPKSEFDTDGHLPVCICVCGHLSVWDICLCGTSVCVGHLSVCVSVHMRVCGHLSVYTCVWTSVCMRVCGHLSVYTCVWTSVCMRVCGHLSVYTCVWTSVGMLVCGHPSVMCVRVTVCPSVCCVFMRVRGHVCPRACGHVRASVCHYNFEMLMCTICILTIIVQFEMDITVHNDMESMV